MNPSPIDIRNEMVINKALSKHLHFAVFVERHVYLRVMDMNYSNARRRDPDGLSHFDKAVEAYELVGIYKLSRDATLEQLAAYVRDDCRHLGLMNP